jgi:two-component system cell cycle sensor histidine kinase/response regulator CckA
MVSGGMRQWLVLSALGGAILLSANLALGATRGLVRDADPTVPEWAETGSLAPASGFMTNLYDISLGLMATLLLVALGWSVSLRRRIIEQTNQIRLQVKREAELEQEYSALFEQANDMVFSLDPAGRFSTLNKAGERILGCSRERLQHTRLEEYAVPEQVAPLQQWLAQCASGTALPPLELEVVARDGTRSILELGGQPVRQEDGHIVGVYGIARDITERKRAEAALRQSEERFSSAFRVSPVAIAISSLIDGCFIDVNESFLRLFGFSREEVVAHSSLELRLWADPDDRLRFEQMLREQRSVCGVECRFRIKSGGVRMTLLFIERIDVGNTPCALMLVHDMTERLGLEDQLRQATKLEAVGRLAAGVAHDFNNLLTVIQGNADLALLRNTQNPAVAKALDRIAQAAQRAAALTRQLLSFSRKQHLQPRPLEMNEVINAATRMFKHLLREDIRLRFKFTGDLPLVNADPGMIEQVIMNLVVNARDAMSKGGDLTFGTAFVQIDPLYVKSHPEAAVGPYVCMSVRDTGCGMDPVTQSRIFEPFFTTKEVGKGTGLGLATVYGIVRQHKGWIEVESEVGKGSTFKVFIPSEPLGSAQTDSRGSPERAEHRKTILVVEDEPTVAEVVRTVLQEDGYRILEASDGLGALQIWNDHRGRIDMLLTDIIMPHGMSGVDLAGNLQALKPDLKVVYTSAVGPEALQPEVLSTKGGRFLAKPHSPAQLLETVRGGLAQESTLVPA